MRSPSWTSRDRSLRIDPQRRTVCVADRPIELAPGLLEVLLALADGSVLPRAGGRALDGRIRALRRCLEDAGLESDRILTVRGQGYRLRIL